jgi:hypothetical protein
MKEKIARTPWTMVDGKLGAVAIDLFLVCLLLNVFIANIVIL